MARYTLEDVREMDMNDLKTMSEKELRAALKVMRDVVRKRIKRLKNDPYGQYSQALRSIEKEWRSGTYESGTKTRKQLIKSIDEALYQDKFQTSTVAGTKAYVYKVVQARGGNPLDMNDVKSAMMTNGQHWAMVDKLGLRSMIQGDAGIGSAESLSIFAEIVEDAGGSGHDFETAVKDAYNRKLDDILNNDGLDWDGKDWEV